MSNNNIIYQDDLIKVYKVTQGSLLSNNYLIIDRASKEACIIDVICPLDDISGIIKAEGLKLEFVILTHGHIDHIDAINKLKKPVYIHEDDLAYLDNPELNLSSWQTDFRVDKQIKVRALKDNSIIKFGNVDFKVIHTPGHTPGSICIYYDKVLFSGDTLFFDGIGRCDLPGGNSSKIITSIRDKLFSLNDETLVFCGHGPKTTIAREKKHNPFL
jgi:glyoxylase-like metal-dependent hydrolase (beta-lactamase superfamily II)